MADTKKLPRVRTVLILVNLSLLVIMAGGLNLLRVYETSLIQQTENELNVQAVLLAASVRQALGGKPDAMLSPPAVTLSSSTPVETADTLTRQAPADYRSPLTTVMKSLQYVIDDARYSTLAAIRVVDRESVIVASSNPDRLGYVMADAEVAVALTGERNARLRTREVEPDQPGLFSISRVADYRVHVAFPVSVDGEVVAAIVLSRTPQAVIQIVVQNLFSVAAYLTLTILFVSLVALATSLTVSQPVAELVALARRATGGEREAMKPLDNPMTEEFRDLSLAIVSMSDRLRQRADYIMELASHISHEFKSPVTSISGALELLQDHVETMSIDERNRFFSNLQQDVARLENLTHQLLTLARADMAGPAGQCELGETLRSLFGESSAPSVTIRIEASPLWVGLDKDAALTIFGNLVANSAQAGAGQVELVLTADAGRANVSVVDDGPGVSPGNAEKVLSPFFTTHRETGGTGLGLNIVASLVQGAGGTFAVESEGPGFGVTISLPLVPDQEVDSAVGA